MRQREAAEINASLHALKECIRARAKGSAQVGGRRAGRRAVARCALGFSHPPRLLCAHPAPLSSQIPFRGSTLTKVLTESFVRPDASLAVVATLAPSPTDTEHTIATLRTACLLGASGKGSRQVLESTEDVALALPKREVVVPPAKWSPADVQKWMRAAGGGQFADAAGRLPSTMTGKLLARWGAGQFGSLCEGEKARGAQLYAAFRAEVQRAADAAAEHRQDLMKAGGGRR